MTEENTIANKYSEISDEELIAKLRDGDDDILDYLLNKFKNLVRGKAKKMYMLGGEEEDLIQEGMIGLLFAIRKYDFGRDASFITFADLCVTRKMYSAIKASNGEKHFPLNHAISTNWLAEDGNSASDDYKKIFELPAQDNAEPEKVAMANDQAKALEALIDTELSDTEKETFNLYRTGMSSGEVAAVLGKSLKTVDNSIQRAKAKLRKILYSRKNIEN